MTPSPRLTLVGWVLASTMSWCPPAEAQVDSPRTLAFVVGIEHYDDPELDKLQYAADDARKFYDLLKVVADVDDDSVIRIADDADKSRITADELRTALQNFVKKLKNRTHVVVYIGGHGTLSANRALWYLPSNYSKPNESGYVSFAEIREAFVDAIKGRALHDVSLTLFVNICGAGTAAGGDRVEMNVETEREIIDLTQKTIRTEQFGLQRYAVIPATPRFVNTYEDVKTLRASVFAHHLLNGLGGGAAVQGVVTTGSLIAYLEQHLNEQLPRNPGFALDIPIGLTRRLEGETEFLMGTALLSVAQSLEPSVQSPERAAHRNALLDLAAEQFARVPEHAADLTSRANLRRAQADVLRGRAPQPLSSDRPQADSDSNEQAQYQELLEPSSPSEILSLRGVRDALQGGAPFYGMIVRERAPTSGPSSEMALPSWRSVLDRFPGRRQLETVILGDGDTLLQHALAVVERWAATEAKSSNLPRLMIIYEGTPNVAPRPSPPAFLRPFGKAEMDLLIEKWPGPVTVFYLGSHGGVLLDSGRPPRGGVSLLLAATQAEGIAIPGVTATNESGGSLLAQAFLDGSDIETLSPVVEALKNVAGKAAKDAVIGTPGWFGDWGGPDRRPRAAEQLAPHARLALHLAAECKVEDIAKCDATTATNDPLGLLASAAESDLQNQHDRALAGYQDAIGRLRRMHADPKNVSDEEPVRKHIGELVTVIDRRTKAVEKRATRKVVVLRLGVDDYTSPLVADLPGTSNDLEAYGAALRRGFEGSSQKVILRDVRMIATAVDMLASIKAERETLGPEDLLILVYSGRATEQSGRRYLSTRATSPCGSVFNFARQGFLGERLAPCASTSLRGSFLRGWNDVVDLWEIANLMRDRWFIAVYDTQFTKPIAEGRPNELLDKHLDSVRRVSPPETRDAAATAIRGWIARQPVFEALPPGALTQGQLHIWLEGTLTADAVPPLSCAPKELAGVASPMAGALLATLPPSLSGSYREWLEKTAGHRCLATSGDPGVQRLVAQGDVDLPLFGSGEASELVEHFRSGDARRYSNIIAGDVLAQEAFARFPHPIHQLSKAAIQLAMPVVHSLPLEHSERGAAAWSVTKPDVWRDAAGELLQTVQLYPAQNGDPDPLLPFLVELRTRVRVLSGDLQGALTELRAAPPLVLAERDLAERLVTLSVETARRQPASLLEEASQRLQAAEEASKQRTSAQANNRLAVARNQLAELRQSETLRRNVRFVIAPPAGSERR
jgi:hypothetical protein